VDVLKVHPGQRRQDALSAYPGMTHSAPQFSKNSRPSGTRDNYGSLRSFARGFSVQGQPTPRLLPDLSAALDLDIGTQNNVLVVPWKSIGIKADHPFVLWLLKNYGQVLKTPQLSANWVLRNDLEARRGFWVDEGGDIIRRATRHRDESASRLCNEWPQSPKLEAQKEGPDRPRRSHGRWCGLAFGAFRNWLDLR